MANYALGFAGVTASVTQDMKTIITTAAGAGSVVRVYEIWVSGEAGSSSVQRFQVFRPAVVGVSATIGAALQVPEKIDPASVAASMGDAGNAGKIAGTQIATSSWGTPPTASTNDVLTPTLNAFGGVIRWVAPPGSEIVVGSQGAVANLCVLRSRSGTNAVSGHVLVSES